jgi:predicted naringenin-chalcone synthase
VEVSKLACVDLARKTLETCPHFGPADITHVITVSCTGFHNPGPDYHIIRGLGLSPNVQRYNLGFMGCYAAFPALRLAKQFCQVDPNAVVLVLCLELCSLHLQLDANNPEALMAGSIFGDGAACALVSARLPDPAQATLVLGELSTLLTDTGEESMAWEIGDHGYEIVLSSYVPDILGDNIRQAVLPMLHRSGLNESDIGFWAVHPGGRAILDRIETALALGPDALAIPRRILRDYGNMSSATILFVLREWMRSPGESELCAAMAFGPGLTVELGLLERIPALIPMELSHA